MDPWNVYMCSIEEKLDERANLKKVNELLTYGRMLDLLILAYI